MTAVKIIAWTVVALAMIPVVVMLAMLVIYVTYGVLAWPR